MNPRTPWLSSTITSTIPRSPPMPTQRRQVSPNIWTPAARWPSITNTQTLTPNLNVAEVFGFIREKIYSTIDQPFTPAAIRQLRPIYRCAADSRPSIPSGITIFPACRSCDTLGNRTTSTTWSPTPAMNIGEGAQVSRRLYRRLPEPLHAFGQRHLDQGKHTITFGGSFSYTQLNTRDDRPNNAGTIGFRRFLAIPAGPGHLLHVRRIRSPPRFCRATPTATTAPTKPASIFRTSSRFDPT